MRALITLLMLILLSACGTVEVFNATYSVNRSRIGAYEVQAIVVPTASSVTVLDVFAIVDERFSPRFPLAPDASAANLYRGPV